MVTPGFIDVHTHYDAQVAWDPYLTPSPLHGVTTAIGGNCGFTLAPIEDEAAEYLVELLARVEGMPLATLEAGVDIRWRTFRGYLDTIEGHAACQCRLPRRPFHRPARSCSAKTGADLPQTTRSTPWAAWSMRACAAGALGLSSSWSETHNDAAGDPVPSRYAEEPNCCAPLRHGPSASRNLARVLALGRRAFSARTLRAHGQNVGGGGAIPQLEPSDRAARHPG